MNWPVGGNYKLCTTSTKFKVFNSLGYINIILAKEGKRMNEKRERTITLVDEGICTKNG